METQVQDMLQQQQSQAERVKNDEAKDMSAFCPGDVMPQGDLYIVGLKLLPKSARIVRPSAEIAEGGQNGDVPKAVPGVQLADGDTQGSRHIHIRGKVYQANAVEVAGLIKDATGAVVDTKYIGPVFEGGTIRHPEHGDHENYPAGVPCAVVFQRSLDREEREQRVVD